MRPEEQDRDRPTLAAVQALIDRLDHEDRARLRPWVLARYDVRGYRAAGFAGLSSGSDGEGEGRRRRPGSTTP